MYNVEHTEDNKRSVFKGTTITQSVKEQDGDNGRRRRRLHFPLVRFALQNDRFVCGFLPRHVPDSAAAAAGRTGRTLPAVTTNGRPETRVPPWLHNAVFRPTRAETYIDR